jgi:hypothetical protein
VKILQQSRSKSQLNASKARDVLGIAHYRSQTTLRLAERLSLMADAVGSEKVAYNAAKLALCGSVANVWTATDMQNVNGEAFDGVGNLWACSLPYCSNCVAVKASRHRRRIRDTLETVKLRVGLKWRFITLTSPSVPASPLESIKVYQTAWALLVRRKFWASRSFGGYRGIEFTVNQSTGLVHCHLHCLAMSQPFNFNELRGVWTECIASAWKQRGVSLHFNTVDEKAIVKVIEPKGKTLGQKALDAAILETAKYAAGAPEWASLSDAHLIEIANLDRFPRLFECFGETRKFGDDTIVHTADLKLHRLKTTKTPSKPDIRTLGLKVNVRRSKQKTLLIKRFPVAAFETLDGREFMPSRTPETTGTQLRLIKPKE